MPIFQILEKNNNKRLTWKNGLGYSDEIAIFPPTAELKKGDFLWRLSSARIEQNSPFSVFPDHDRFLVVITGAGLRLTHTFVEGEEEEKVEIPPLSPYEFPGDVPSGCELLSGPITDLSLFIRKGEIEAHVETASILDGEDFTWVPKGRWNFIFVASGSIEARDQLLATGDTLGVELASPGTTPLILHAARGDAALITLSLHAS